MYIKFKFNGYKAYKYNYKSKVMYFKSTEDIYTYINKYNTNCRISQDRGRITDFDIIDNI